MALELLQPNKFKLLDSSTWSIVKVFNKKSKKEDLTTLPDVYDKIDLSKTKEIIANLIAADKDKKEVDGFLKLGDVNVAAKLKKNYDWLGYYKSDQQEVTVYDKHDKSIIINFNGEPFDKDVLKLQKSALNKTPNGGLTILNCDVTEKGDLKIKDEIIIDTVQKTIKVSPGLENPLHDPAEKAYKINTFLKDFHNQIADMFTNVNELPSYKLRDYRTFEKTIVEEKNEKTPSAFAQEMETLVQGTQQQDEIISNEEEPIKMDLNSELEEDLFKDEQPIKVDLNIEEDLFADQPKVETTIIEDPPAMNEGEPIKVDLNIEEDLFAGIDAGISQLEKEALDANKDTMIIDDKEVTKEEFEKHLETYAVETEPPVAGKISDPIVEEESVIIKESPAPVDEKPEPGLPLEEFVEQMNAEKSGIEAPKTETPPPEPPKTQEQEASEQSTQKPPKQSAEEREAIHKIAHEEGISRAAAEVKYKERIKMIEDFNLTGEYADVYTELPWPKIEALAANEGLTAKEKTIAIGYTARHPELESQDAITIAKLSTQRDRITKEIQAVKTERDELAKKEFSSVNDSRKLSRREIELEDAKIALGEQVKALLPEKPQPKRYNHFDANIPGFNDPRMQ